MPRNPNLVLLCGLWRQTSRGGMEYLKGKTNRNLLVDAGHTLLIFPNNRREKENSPEFFLYSSPPGDQGQGNTAGPGGTAAHSGRGSKKDYADTHKVGSPPSEEPEAEGEVKGKTGDDDVPF